MAILGGDDATGLLPQFLYKFRGVDGGYTAQTGATLADATLRPITNKLDEIVNVKDFGALGDGVSNDLAAIQRAIDQTYDRFAIYTKVTFSS